LKKFSYTGLFSPLSLSNLLRNRDWQCRGQQFEPAMLHRWKPLPSKGFFFCTDKYDSITIHPFLYSLWNMKLSAHHCNVFTYDLSHYLDESNESRTEFKLIKDKGSSLKIHFRLNELKVKRAQK
jgi:hypothetical protein